MTTDITPQNKSQAFVKISEDVKQAANNLVETSQIIKEGSKDLAPVAVALGVGLIAYAAASLFGNHSNDNKNNPL